MTRHRNLLVSALFLIPLATLSCTNQADSPLDGGGGTGGLGFGTSGTSTSGGTFGTGDATGGTSSADAGGTANRGGTSAGGATSGGAANGGTSSTSSGGAASGGATNGGSKAVGGSTNGGSKAVGGSTNGGASTGGTNAVGGATTGGASTGGTSAVGGATTGGASTGGTNAVGGATTGGASTGGTNAVGGATTGGAASGGTTAAGGAATGGSTGNDTCTNNNADKSGAANIDFLTEYQNISGFGGISVPGWIADLTTAQANTAFGTGAGQLGLSILRVRISPDQSRFSQELPTAKIAVSLGAKVMATPWTPPAGMKTNNNTVGGRLNTGSYGAYADHLLSFRDYMETNGVPIYAISVQNEPDITVDYESCFWNSTEFINWLTAHGSKFGTTKVIAAESYKFDRTVTDPILNNGAAADQVDIIAGHIYGSGLADYPLARTKGKEIWMTEHYTESNNSANAWPLALDVGKEIHDCMAANFSAYVWWYIRRSYGLLTEDGNVSKRGYLMAQYSRFIRPGATRIAASKPSNSNVFVSAYKGPSGGLVVVAVNMNTSSQTVTLNLRNGCADSFARYTTSGSKSLASDSAVTLTSNSAAVTLDAQSVTTFVSQ